MANNLLDDTLLLEVGEGLAGKGTVDLQSVDENGGGDETVGQDILVKALLDVLVHGHSMLSLVLNCSRNRESATVSSIPPLSAFLFRVEIAVAVVVDIVVVALSSCGCRAIPISQSSFEPPPPPSHDVDTNEHFETGPRNRNRDRSFVRELAEMDGKKITLSLGPLLLLLLSSLGSGGGL